MYKRFDFFWLLPHRSVVLSLEYCWEVLICSCEWIKDMQIGYLPIVPHSPELQSSSSIAPFCVSLDLLLKTLEDCLSQSSCALPGGC